MALGTGGLLYEATHDSLPIGSHDSALRWIWHLMDPQSDLEILRTMKSQHVCQGSIGEHIAIENEEHFLRSHKPAVLRQSAGAAHEPMLFRDHHVPHAPLLYHKITNLIGMRVHVQQHLGDSSRSAILEPDLKQRHASDRQQTLGDSIGERPQPSTASGGKNESLHIDPG